MFKKIKAFFGRDLEDKVDRLSVNQLQMFLELSNRLTILTQDLQVAKDMHTRSGMSVSTVGDDLRAATQDIRELSAGFGRAIGALSRETQNLVAARQGGEQSVSALALLENQGEHLLVLRELVQELNAVKLALKAPKEEKKQ